MAPTILDPYWNKFKHAYHVKVDPLQNNCATEIRLCSLDRPHMRAFHCSWWSFLVAFFMWFSITPLLSDLADDLDLTNDQIWNSSIASVAGTFFMRILLGPLCDKYGPRMLFAALLCWSAIPCAGIGLVKMAHQLYVVRACIGMVGGTFVMCQAWTSLMFTKEIVGMANGIVAGWGNLGAGITQIVMGSILFPCARWISNGDTQLAWRVAPIVPAILGLVTGCITYRFSDDSRNGDYWELKCHGAIVTTAPLCQSLWAASTNLNTWLLAFQYACCFGVELTINSAAVLYFKDVYGQSTESAAAIASIFGWMNLFARGMGGCFSDYANVFHGMQGRFWVVSALLLGEGIFLFIFSNTSVLAWSIMIMIWFSLFVQAAEGAIFGVVPELNANYREGGSSNDTAGSIIGIVRTSGNEGATMFGFAFRQFCDYQMSFRVIGISILISACFSPLI
jgi:MFS transporter, NNP family, nitrate/nitrite transporter